MRTILATLLTLCLAPLAFSETTRPFVEEHFSKTAGLVLALAVLFIILKVRKSP